MQIKKQTGSVILGVALALGAGGLAVNSVSWGKEDSNRHERMRDEKWTNADRARDALDHLKKARTELENITNDKKDAGAASDALNEVKQAIEHVDKYIAASDKK